MLCMISLLVEWHDLTGATSMLPWILHRDYCKIQEDGAMPDSSLLAVILCKLRNFGPGRSSQRFPSRNLYITSP